MSHSLRSSLLHSGAAALVVTLLAAACPAAAGDALSLLTTKATESGPVVVGKPAPRFGGWDVTGKVLLLSEALRTKPAPAPLLLAFGSASCAPAREGLPRLQRFAAKHPEVRLVLVAVEKEQRVAAEFARSMGVATALHDKFEIVSKAYGLVQDGRLTLPRAFLIGADGRVAAIYFVQGTDLEDVLEVDLAALLAQPAAAPAVRPGAAPAQ